MQGHVSCAFGLLLLLIFSPGDASASVLAQSTFDTDLDGWTTILITPGSPSSNITFAPASGNPGGAARHDAPSEGLTSYFFSPGKFPTALHSAVGGSIAWDISTVSHTGDTFFVSSDLTINTPGGLRIRQFVTPPVPIFPDYLHYEADFTTADGWMFSDGGPQTLATQDQIDAVLLAASLLVIRAEYWSGPTPDISFLDNVIVRGVPEPASLALLSLGVAGLLLRRRGSSR